MESIGLFALGGMTSLGMAGLARWLERLYEHRRLMDAATVLKIHGMTARRYMPVCHAPTGALRNAIALFARAGYVVFDSDGCIVGIDAVGYPLRE